MIQNQVVDSNKEWKITFCDEIVFDSNIKNNIIVRDKEEVVPICGSYEGVCVVDEYGNEILSLGEEFDKDSFIRGMK